jgi:hypothetical protein
MTAAASMKYSDALPSHTREEDRLELAAGVRISITDIVIDTQTKYGEIVRMNGEDLDTRAQVKYRTTSKVVAGQAKELLANRGGGDGHFRIPIDVQVYSRKSNNNKEYLSLGDPAE